MTELQSALQALSGDAKRQLAHSLLLALEGRTGDRPALDADPVSSPKFRQTVGAADESPGKSMGSPDPARTIRAKGETPGIDGAAPDVRTRERPAPGVYAGTSAPSTEGDSLRQSSAPFAVLRRDPPGFDSLPTESTEPDPVRQIRRLSDYLRQDSRRYDPGFTRY